MLSHRGRTSSQSNFVSRDYGAYYRKAKRAMETALVGGVTDTYPEPTDHCDICRWFDNCERRRRDDDHLSYVAGISQGQIAELVSHDIKTLAALAELPKPIPWKPERWRCPIL